MKNSLAGLRSATCNLHSDIGREATACPACGRYIGLMRTCRFCDCDVPLPPPLKYLKALSLILGVGGLAMLVMMAMTRDVPEVKISRISPIMDYAVVSVTGSVERKPYVIDDQGQRTCVSFVINDGSGKLRVAAYRSVARKLIENGAIPESGSSIKVSGRINITKGGEPKLVLSSLEGINFLREG